MALKHTLLGLLSLRPFSGYDLKKQFDRTVRHFWAADQAQIYRTLYRLEDEGAVAATVVPQSGRPDRKEYRITETGLEELDAWLRSPVEEPPVREPFLARMFFAGRLQAEETVALIDARIAAAEKGLAALHAVAAESEERLAAGPQSLGELLRLATLENGVRHHLAEIAWLRDLRSDVMSATEPRARSWTELRTRPRDRTEGS